MMPAALDLQLVAVGALAGAVRGFSGFGAGLVLAPVLVATLGPTTAVPLLLLIEIGASCYLVPGALRQCRREIVAHLSAPACLLFPAGTLLLLRLDAATVRVGVSLLVLGMALFLATGWRLQGSSSRPLLVATGGLSGLLNGFGGIGGPPVIFLLMSTPGDSRDTRADFIAFFALVNVAALITFASLGLLSTALLRWLLVIFPAFAAGMVAGSRRFRQASEATYRLAVLLIVIASALFGLLAS